jgi:hypothetical protein
MMGTELPRDCFFIEIPNNQNQKLLALYLTLHPAVDRLIASGTLRTTPLMEFINKHLCQPPREGEPGRSRGFKSGR